MIIVKTLLSRRVGHRFDSCHGYIIYNFFRDVFLKQCGHSSFKFHMKALANVKFKQCPLVSYSVTYIFRAFQSIFCSTLKGVSLHLVVTMSIGAWSYSFAEEIKERKLTEEEEKIRKRKMNIFYKYRTGRKHCWEKFVFLSRRKYSSNEKRLWAQYLHFYLKNTCYGQHIFQFPYMVRNE